MKVAFSVIFTQVSVGWKASLVTNVWLSSLCILQNCSWVLVFAGHFFQQEPCVMCWWWEIFLTACFFMCFTCLEIFPDSLAVFSLCLAVTFSSSPLFHCSFLFWGFFPPFFTSLGYSLLLLTPFWLFAKCRTSSVLGQHVFLQLLYECRRDILDIEAAVFLSFSIPGLPPRGIDLLWEPRENGRGILKLSAIYP